MQFRNQMIFFYFDESIFVEWRRIWQRTIRILSVNLIEKREENDLTGRLMLSGGWGGGGGFCRLPSSFRRLL
jgi:hypothetical protein